MAKDPRVHKAITAMKRLTFPQEDVIAVLRKLLKLYEKRWELIEEDNYATLVEAILEYQKEEKNDVNSSRNNYNLKDHSENRHEDLLDDQAPSVRESHNGRADREEVQLLSLEAGEQELKDSSLSQSARNRGNLHSSTYQASTRQNSLAGRESKVQTNERENFQGDHQHGLVASHKRKELDITIQQITSEKDKRVDGSVRHRASLQSTLNIASSTCGKVIISLTCKSNGLPNSWSPNIDAVVKHAEDKYLRSYKIIGPEFSLVQFLKELCNSFLELSSNSTVNSLVSEIMGPNQQGSSRDNIEIKINKRIRKSESSSSSSLVVAQKHSISLEKRRPLRKLPDITNGTEKVRISLLDEFGNERLPDFVYIPQNISYQGAYVQVSLARISDEDCCASCEGDCLSSSFPCACARVTGGEFAYTTEGLLKEKFLDACILMSEGPPEDHHYYYCSDCPCERAKNAHRPEKCKGHLVRKFVKECWRKCRCSMQCGNRVVQRGITCKLQVFLTAGGKGWGLRTLEEIPKGAFVCEYVGEILTNMELYERNKRNCKDRHTYPVLMDADWGTERVLKDEDALCLDATYYGNVGRFINHRCNDANLIDIPVEVETPDRHYYHLAFFTKKKVAAFEELTWDYGIDFNDHNHPIEAFQCSCGSARCRDLKGKGIIKQNSVKNHATESLMNSVQKKKTNNR
ncbi:OLC1v1025886C3 [Oldenlandia corymbosa var. corymbosa]|uniref:OLC1v1025886C3 n=1 Tax=Oldenlandia corymbosa var. corymbosa TaxID=529605 RepID=A0AAV1C765_OLDCO|nr:OLC1v1025886C3 [Oldenlandia corymbosa var. corymbosa]